MRNQTIVSKRNFDGRHGRAIENRLTSHPNRIKLNQKTSGQLFESMNMQH